MQMSNEKKGLSKKRAKAVGTLTDIRKKFFYRGHVCKSNTQLLSLFDVSFYRNFILVLVSFSSYLLAILRSFIVINQLYFLFLATLLSHAGPDVIYKLDYQDAFLVIKISFCRVKVTFRHSKQFQSFLFGVDSLHFCM